MNTAMPYNKAKQTVVETPEFQRAAKELKLSASEIAHIVDLLADDPMLGDEIAGTGGARKVRVARPGEGKSGGYRVIYFFSGEYIPIFLLSVFAKNQKINLTHGEKNTLKKVLKLLVENHEISEVQQ